MLTPQELRDIFDYDPETGMFTWRVKVGTHGRPGIQAGCINGRGYILLRYQRRAIPAHRAAWAHHYGEWPTLHIDHVNGTRTDNRIENLRQCTPLQNQFNKLAQASNRSGIRGVRFCAENRWLAQIRINGRLKYLGTFPTSHEAETAYKTAAEVHCGQFASHLSRNRDTTP